MIRRPPRSTRTDTLFPYATRFRSLGQQLVQRTERTCRRAADGIAFERSIAAAVVTVDHRVALRVDSTNQVSLGVVLERGRQAGIGHWRRSEERRGGKACVSTCGSRWSP